MIKTGFHLSDVERNDEYSRSHEFTAELNEKTIAFTREIKRNAMLLEEGKLKEEFMKNSQRQEQQQIEQNVTNTLIEKIRKTGLDVIIDKEKMREILESGQYVQKMAAYHGTSHENEGEIFEPEKKVGAIYLDNVKKRLGESSRTKNALSVAKDVLLDFDGSDKSLIGLHLQKLGASSPEKLEAVFRGELLERKVSRDKNKSKDDGRGGR